MNKRIILNILLAVFTAVTILLTGFIGFLLVTHTKAYTVQSGSMSPAFKKGDVVFARPVEAKELQTGDIITVKTPDDSRFFTHRITRFDEEKTVVYTKGDSNKSEDPMPADITLVAGRVWLSVPYLGILSTLAQNKLVLIALAFVVLLLTAIRFIVTLFKNKNGGGAHAAKQK